MVFDINRLTIVVDKINDFSIPELIRTKDLGSHNDFSQGEPNFKGIEKLVKDLQKIDILLVPPKKFNGIIEHIRQIGDLYDKIKVFKLTDEGASDKHEKLLNSLESMHETLFDLLSPVVLYFGTNLEDYQNIALNQFKELKDIHNEAKNLKIEMETINKNNKDESKNIIASLRESLGKAGVGKHGGNFGIVADEYHKSSKKWLIAIISISVLTILFGIWILTSDPAKSDMPSIIKYAITRLAFFSILYFGLIWSGRIFKSDRHNFILNKHRQNALDTFETFVKAADNEQIKERVLIQATHTIFSQQSTGFIHKDSESSNFIAELLKPIIQKNT